MYYLLEDYDTLQYILLTAGFLSVKGYLSFFCFMNNPLRRVFMREGKAQRAAQ